MHFLAICSIFLVAIKSAIAAKMAQVHVQIDHAVECERKSQKGDTIYVHYRGTLQDGGKQFDSSYDRKEPLSFVVGQGMVIKGWDQNLLDMCINDKRTLTIPPEFGYGSKAMGPIPPSSVLIFETELVGIEGVEAPKPPAEEAVQGGMSKLIQSVKSVVQDKITDATDAAKALLSNYYSDGKERKEL